LVVAIPRSPVPGSAARRAIGPLTRRPSRKISSNRALVGPFSFRRTACGAP
jgi:hypothetical protein